MWQCFLEIVDLITKLVQTSFAGFGLWLAWKTFIKEDEQESSGADDFVIYQESVPDLKIFETSKQTTWLKKTENGLECHIDEHRKDKVGGHKWAISPSQVKGIVDAGDIYVNSGYKLRTGQVSIGNHLNWLYSKKLFPEPSRLHHKVIELLSSVK